MVSIGEYLPCAVKDKDPFFLHIQYHGCWSPGHQHTWYLPNYPEKWNQVTLNVVLALYKLFANDILWTLQWRHNERDSVSNHQPHDRLLNRLIRRRSKKMLKLCCHWPLCGEFTGDRWIPRTNSQQRGKFSISWRHHGIVTRGAYLIIQKK